MKHNRKNQRCWKENQKVLEQKKKVLTLSNSCKCLIYPNYLLSQELDNNTVTKHLKRRHVLKVCLPSPTPRQGKDYSVKVLQKHSNIISEKSCCIKFNQYPNLKASTSMFHTILKEIKTTNYSKTFCVFYIYFYFQYLLIN